MPAYNAEKYIADAINSVVEQTYQNWELIVVDDCSSDDTALIIKEFAQKESRIKPVLRDINSKKPSIAKNTAIPYIKGKYVAFLDSDDVWMPTKIEKQIAIMEGGEYALCYTGGILINQDSKEVGEFLPRYKNGNIFRCLLFRYEINNQSVMVKVEVFDKFNEKITIGEDYNLFMHIVYNNQVCNIKEKLIKYRIHSSSITKNKTKDLSEGTLFTLNELNQKQQIFWKYPLEFIWCWIKASRYKLV